MNDKRLAALGRRKTAVKHKHPPLPVNVRVFAMGQALAHKWIYELLLECTGTTVLGSAMPSEVSSYCFIRSLPNSDGTLGHEKLGSWADIAL